MDRLSALLGHHVQFTYTAWDRIVLIVRTGYLERLQRPENLVYFFRRVVWMPSVTPEVLASRTASYRAGMTDYAAREAIPLLVAPKGARKEDVVQPPYERLRRQGTTEGVACILCGLETSRTFVSYPPRYPPPADDPGFRLIRVARQRFLHYYCYVCYVLDPVAGPMSLRLATYLPCTVACYLNGPSFLAPRRRQEGVGFPQDDNAIVAVDDVAALQAAADRLTPAVREERCATWTERLAPRFSPAERAALGGLRYRYSVAQIELATDVRFHRPAPLKALFGRAAELGILLGGADHTAHLFGRRVTRRHVTAANCRRCSTGGRRGIPGCARTTTPRASSSTRKATGSCAPKPWSTTRATWASGAGWSTSPPPRTPRAPGGDQCALPGRASRAAGQHRRHRCPGPPCPAAGHRAAARARPPAGG